MNNLLDHPLVQEVRRIAQARHISLILVGGAVRDWLMGHEVRDLDFAVQGNARQLARAVADATGGAYYLMDAERNTARVIVTQGNRSAIPARITASFHLDFAVCRGETWAEDLFGRDFSVNAMALDVLTGALLDPTGGQSDLQYKLVRQVTTHAMTDDPVRALRAVRTMHLLGGRLDSVTAQSISRAATHLDQPSPERVRDELMKVLDLPDAMSAVRQLDTLGLLPKIVPEVDLMRDCTQSAPHQFTVLEHTFVVLEAVDRLIHGLRSASQEEAPGFLRSFLPLSSSHASALLEQLDAVTADERMRKAVFRLAVLLHDVAKPARRRIGEDGCIHFSGHEEAGAEMAASRAAALRMSGEETRQVRTTVRHHGVPNKMEAGQDTSLNPHAVYRFMHDAGRCAPEIALFCLADGYGKAGPEASHDDLRRRGAIASHLIERYEEHYKPSVAPKPLVSGADILALGIPKGPRIGQALQAIREAQMVGELTTRDDALSLARHLETYPDGRPDV